ncbi:MAG: TQO small subunit DoxD [Chloroflexota bacterium]
MTVESPPNRWITNLQKIVLLIARVGLAYLFFTQLWWKAPPTFGCPADYKFTVADSSGKLQRTTGLCDWIGVESVWAQRDRPLLVANLDNKGAPEVFINISLPARINGAFIDGFVKPNIQWFGWVIWGSEAFIFVSLFFGIFTRLGGLVAIGMSAQLMIGLAGISSPYEWEWGYNNMVLLAIVIFAFAPGRFVGIDGLLYPPLKRLADNGNPVGRVGLLLVGR